MRVATVELMPPLCLRRLTIVAILLAIVVGLAAVWASRSPCPIEFSFVKFEPGEMVDDAGRDLWLVTLGMSNLSNLYLQPAYESVAVRTRTADQWVEAESSYDLGDYLPPRGSRKVLLAIPAGAEACRLGFSHRREAATSQWLRRIELAVINKSPYWNQWLWMKGLTPSVSRSLQKARWKRTTIEVVFPREVAAKKAMPLVGSSTNQGSL